MQKQKRRMPVDSLKPISAIHVSSVETHLANDREIRWARFREFARDLLKSTLPTHVRPIGAHFTDHFEIE